MKLSKNFELLHREDELDLFIPVDLTNPPRPAEPSPVLVKERIHEEIEKLVQRLFLHAGPTEVPRIVSFSSIENEKRSSWICAQAAKALAIQSNRSVCVVDANLGSPQLHLHFHAENVLGLADALLSKGLIRTFARPLAIAKLSLMPAGSATADLYADLERLRLRFRELREQFDYVLISTSSVSRENGAIVVGQRVDGMVLIVEANQVRRDVVLQAKQRLNDAKVQLLGAVLDRRTFPIPESLYRKL